MLPALHGMTPVFNEHELAVYHADCRDALAAMPDGVVSAIVTDPPYEMNMKNDARISEWDSTEIAFDPKMWEQCLRVLKPGGHLITFGGPRTWHRMVVAIEDAGFEIRGTIAWLYGTGFSRPSDLETAIAEVSPAAVQQWRGWGLSLKPAFEPIVLARRPVSTKAPVAFNLLINQTGALNIDACRTESGRYPTNALVDEQVAQELDLQSGPRDRARVEEDDSDEEPEAKPAKRSRSGRDNYADDNQGASKYFNTFKYQPKAPPRERPRVNGVAHPTVKPLDLIKWCTRLITPPGGIVLDPFAGSGTTAQACLENGFACVAIEACKEYIPLIEHRINEVLKTWPELISDVHLIDQT